MRRLLVFCLLASAIYGAQTVSTPTTYLNTATITINSGSAFTTQNGVTVQFGGNRLLGVDTPIDPTDGVNKAYVDALVSAIPTPSPTPTATATATATPTPTATPTATAVVFPHAVTLVCDGSGSVVSTGTKNPVKIPYGGTLVGWLLIGSPSGSVTVDVFRAADGAGLPVTSIIGGSGTKPALSSAVENSSTSFTSWTSTTLTAKDNLAISLSGINVLNLRGSNALLPMKLVLLLFLVLITSRAFGAFGYQSAVTVDHTKVPSTQTDFPVLISITDARFKTTGNGGHVGNANGYDIRPHSDTACSAALNYELERYNATTGEVIMWVKIASLSSSVDTVIRLAYGDAGITTDGSSTAVWSNSFKYVVHAENGTTLSLTDSTGTYTVNNNNSVTAAAGEIDGAANFVSSSSQSFENASGSAFTDGAQTWSAWVRPTTLTGAEHTIIGKGFGGSEYGVIAVKTSGKLRTNFLVDGGGGSFLGYDGTGIITLSTNTWYYVVMTYNSSVGMVVYVNNSVDQTVSPNGALYTAVAIAAMAGGNRGTGNKYWDGQIDEVRTSSVVRSADWITTEYNNQSNPGTFQTLASEQIGCPLTALERSYGYIDGVFSIK